MRNTSHNSPQFTPGNPGNIQDVPGLLRYMQDLESRLQTALAALATGHRDAIYAEPPRPRFGDVVLVGPDGWNPGGGEGMYLYNSAGQWVKLG